MEALNLIKNNFIPSKKFHVSVPFDKTAWISGEKHIQNASIQVFWVHFSFAGAPAGELHFWFERILSFLVR